MIPKRGDLVQILKDTHGYPDGWIRGTDPTRFPNGSTGILLDVQPPSHGDPRTFFKIATPQGSVQIFSGFVNVIQ